MLDRPTSLLKRRADMPRQPFPECHEGVGVVDWTNMLSGNELEGRRLNFIHDDIIPPGASIGVHPHHDQEEIYIILAGEGVMTLDDVEHPVGPGDATVVFPGGNHGLKNTGSADLRLIVVNVRAE